MNFEFVLKSGKSLGADKLESLKGTIWVDLIDWDRTRISQFKGMKIPEWISVPNQE
jgi:hypothetical protein